MNAPAVFNFNSNEVRTLEKDNQIWFVLSDVAEALEFSRGRDSARMMDDDEKGAHIMRTPGGEQEVTIINESGLYSLILKSRKASAKVFKKWVTSEVLPSIRKTGAYAAPAATITPAQQNTLQQIVAFKAGDSGGLRAYCWSRFNNHFHLGSYKQLPAAYFDEAKAYLETLPMKKEPALAAPVIQPSFGMRILTRFEGGSQCSAVVVANDALVMSREEFEAMLKSEGKVIVPAETVDIIKKLQLLAA